MKCANPPRLRLQYRPAYFDPGCLTHWCAGLRRARAGKRSPHYRLWNPERLTCPDRLARPPLGEREPRDRRPGQCFGTRLNSHPNAATGPMWLRRGGVGGFIAEAGRPASGGGRLRPLAARTLHPPRRRPTSRRRLDEFTLKEIRRHTRCRWPTGMRARRTVASAPGFELPRDRMAPPGKLRPLPSTIPAGVILCRPPAGLVRRRPTLRSRS